MSDDDGAGQQQGAGSGSGSGGGARRAPTAARSGPALLSVVEFEHADPIDRLPYRAFGVVVAVDEQSVTVRPLADHRLQVAVADVAELSADDSGEV